MPVPRLMSIRAAALTEASQVVPFAQLERGSANYRSLDDGDAPVVVSNKRRPCTNKRETRVVAAAAVVAAVLLVVMFVRVTPLTTPHLRAVSAEVPSVSSIIHNHDTMLVLYPHNYMQVLRNPLPAAFQASFSHVGVRLDINVHAVPGQVPRQMWGGRHGWQFTNQRAAVLLMPGEYPKLTIELGYYVTVHGLGHSPSDVRVKAVQSSVKSCDGQFTSVFWKGVENLSVMGDMRWWVSQATYLRRVIVHGDLTLDGGAAPPVL